MKYADWLKEFVKGKRLVALFDESVPDAVHDVHRYIDGDWQLWETAISYAGKVVVRSGAVGKDGVTIEWQLWVTQDEIEAPPNGRR